MPSPASSRRRPDIAAAAALFVVAAFGLAAERDSSAWSDASVWVPDLAVGWAFLAAAALSGRRPATGALLGATGVAWFFGAAWPALTFLHRAVLTHLALAAPGWRPRGRVDQLVVAAVYLASVRPDLWRHDLAASVVAVGVVALAVARYIGSPNPERPVKHLGLIAAVGLAVAVAGSALARQLSTSLPSDWILAGYQAAMVWIAVTCVVRVRSAPVASVTDLIVDLGDDERAGPLEEALRAALGDPRLRVGYRAAGGGYVDAAGRDVDPPGDGRLVTTIGDEGAPVAILVHDASIGADARLVEAVRIAARLRRTNAELTAEINRRIDEVAASRRRLLDVADEERRQLEARLRSGPERSLDDLRVAVAALAFRSGCDPSGPLAQAGVQLTETLADLLQIAEGLHPRDLDGGLAGALASVAARCPVTVGLDVGEVGQLPRDVSVALYFVCAEALTNVARHAAATSVDVTVIANGGAVVLQVVDDGRGGADLASGTGLRGLVDRVEALGGRLHVASPDGDGTTVTAELPLGFNRSA